MAATKRKRKNSNNTKNIRKKKLNNTINYFESIHYNNIEYNYIKTASFKKDSGNLRAVVLDIDETLGSFLAFKKLVEDYDKDEYAEFIKEIGNFLTNPKQGASSFRPGIKMFLQKLKNLKDSKKIDAVIIYTNMIISPFLQIDENIYTRPQILCDIFDEMLDLKEPLCDLIIFRKSSYPSQKYIKVIEDIYENHNKDNKFVFIDDKPENIFNTKNSIQISDSAYGITEYKGRNTNKSFNDKYSAKKVDNQSVFEVLDTVF